MPFQGESGMRFPVSVKGVLLEGDRVVLNVLFWNFHCAESDPAGIAARLALHHQVG